MTDKQKDALCQLRAQGLGYSRIAKVLGLTKSQVSGYCKRHGLDGVRSNNERTNTSPQFCKQCGTSINQKPHTKTSLFCSRACRQAWWNSHLNLVNKQAIYNFTCACCGQAFTSYGNRNRKYCSHACYINHRYHKGGTSRE